MLHGEPHRDVRPVRKAQEHRIRDPVDLQEVQEVPGELPDGKRCAAPGGLPVAPGIQRDDTVSILEMRDLMPEVRAVLPVSVQEDQRLPLPFS